MRVHTTSHAALDSRGSTTLGVRLAGLAKVGTVRSKHLVFKVKNLESSYLRL